MILIIAIGVATGCVYALIAVGYSLVYRTTGVVNFAQGSYAMIGGFSTYWYSQVAGLPYAAAILLGVATAGLTGLILWIVVVRPLWRKRSPPYVVLLATIVFGAIVSTTALLALGPVPQSLPPWIPGWGIEFNGGRIEGQYAIVVAATILLMALFSAVLRFSLLGRKMRACAANRETAQLLGISPERIGLIGFVVTAVLGGLGGAMITPAQFTSADIGLTFGVFGFVAAVIGGFGSLPGALLGGIVLGVVNALVGRYISSSYQTFIAFGVLLTLLTLRPQGLMGRDWEES
jgi:branched-chain amino acid transport system permease protein